MVRHASFFSQLVALFHRGHFLIWSFAIKPNGVPKAFAVGIILQPCFSASLHKLKVFVKSVADCLVAWVNSDIWGLKKRPVNPLCPMPMRIDHGKCIATFFIRPLSCVKWPVLHSPIFPTARNMMSPSPVKCRCQEIDWLSFLQVSGRDQGTIELFAGRFQGYSRQETENCSSGGRWRVWV